jgi:hypothetical protein
VIIKWTKLIINKINKKEESKIIKNKTKSYLKNKNNYLHNNNHNKITRKTNNCKNKLEMKIPNIEALRMMRITKIWWTKNLCWNLMNSKFKMLLIDFSHRQVFKDLNTWKASNSYLRLSCKNKSKNLKLNLREDRNKSTNRTE